MVFVEMVTLEFQLLPDAMISALERDMAIKTTTSTQIVEILTNVGFILKFRLWDQSDFVDLDQIFFQITEYSSKFHAHFTRQKMFLFDGKEILNGLFYQLTDFGRSASQLEK